MEHLTAEMRRRVADLGYELADLRRRGTERRPLVQLRIDRPGAEPGRGITHEDCQLVSRALERWLDADGVLGQRYVLEVSSPGIERPIRWPEHWQRFRGQDVNVRIAGRGRLRATIVDVVPDEATVVLQPKGTEENLTVPLEDARDATLAFDWD